MKRLILLAALASLSACIGYKDSAHDISPTLGDAQRHNIAVQAEAAAGDESTTDGARAARAVDLYRAGKTPTPATSRASDVGAAPTMTPR